MSLGIVIKSPSGLVLAADSRVTLGVRNARGESFPVHYDNATKLIRFNEPHSFVAAVTFGQAVIPPENRTADSYLPEFEAALPRKRMLVQAFAEALSIFYMDQWRAALPYSGPEMVFYVAGYDEPAAPYGRVFLLKIPSSPLPIEMHVGSFGASWGGQTKIVDRIYRGFDVDLPDSLAKTMALTAKKRSALQDALKGRELAIPIPVMALQDCVTLAITLIRTTIALQQLSVEVRGVGGPVDIVTITRVEGLKTVQFKEVRGDVP